MAQLRDTNISGNLTVSDNLKINGNLEVVGETISNLEATQISSEKFKITQDGTYVEHEEEFDLDNYGMDLNNNDIIGCNSIYFSDVSNNASEGIHFVGSSKDEAYLNKPEYTTTLHSLWCDKNGELHYTPNREKGAKSTTSIFSIDSSGILTLNGVPIKVQIDNKNTEDNKNDDIITMTIF